MMKKIRKLLLALFTCIPLLTSCSLFKKQYTASLDASEVTLDVNEERTMELSVFYQGNLIKDKEYYGQSWSSSNENVVSVDQGGKVIALNEGTAIVTATVHITNIFFNGYIDASCSFTIKDDNPVKLTLNKTNASVQCGKTMQLVPTVEHTSNKSVTWSSDSSLITVNKSGLVSVSDKTLAGTVANITATSVADSNAKATCKITAVTEPVSKYDYTIMFYMSGSTLEYDPEEYGGYRASSVQPALFTQDIKEILSVNLPENVKVIIETGGSKKWAMESSYLDGASSISSSSLQRWEVLNHKLKYIDTYKNNRMASEESFEDFLKWGIGSYDAEQIGVVISGHGAGMGGCAVDDNYTYTYGGYTYEHTLNTEEISKAVKNALTATSHEKLTWIGFDCCLMQCADMASVLTDYFDYMVASQEEEMGEGWDHDVYMQEIVKNTNVLPEVLLPKICSSFVESGHKTYCKSSEPCLQTLSALNLKKMDTFTKSFNSFIASKGYSSIEYKKYKTAFIDAYNEFGGSCYGLVDFKDYLVKICSRFTGTYPSELFAALEDVVIANSYCSSYGSFTPCGLNAFFPYSYNREYDLQVGKDDYNTNSTKFTQYQQMCYSNGAWAF